MNATAQSLAAEPTIVEKIGPGVIVMVVGPSGSGKDTLLREAANLLRDNTDIVFPRRAITRISDPLLEDHDTITCAEFASMCSGKEAALSWEAHGNGYIIPANIDVAVRAGGTVIFNSSRSVIGKALHRYENVGVIQVTVPAAILAERLTARGREDTTEINRRLERADFEIPAGIDFTNVINDGTAEEGARAMIRAIEIFKTG